MLKSEMDKLENLSPQEVARDFRNRLNAFNIFENVLSEKHQRIIYGLVYDLLEDNYKSDSGYFFRKLLAENNISYVKLAQYIDAYLYCNNETMAKDLDNIKSHLQKMTSARTFDYNHTLSKLVCKYFSVDEDLIKYGFGNRYRIDYQKVLDEFGENAENIFFEVLKEYNLSIENPSEQVYLDYREFLLNSAELHSELLQLETSKNIDFLVEEKVCLWDFTYLIIMINRLSVKEQYAVFNLIKQIAKL